MRHELTAALAVHQVAADRRADMELVFTEAANNAVVHAYRWHGAGPLYAAASLGGGGAVIVWVSDAGRGMRRGSGSPGAGFGLLLMRQLADDLRVCSDPDEGGTCVCRRRLSEPLFVMPPRACQTEPNCLRSEKRTHRRAVGRGRPGRSNESARVAPYEDAAAISCMFLVTTVIVRPSSSVGLNSTTSVPAYRTGVCPGPT